MTRTCITCLKVTSDRPETKLSNQLSELLKVEHHEWNVMIWIISHVAWVRSSYSFFMEHYMCVTSYMICEL